MGITPGRSETAFFYYYLSMISKHLPYKSVLLSLALLAGCSWMRPGSGLKSCGYQLRSMAFAGMDSSGSHWNMKMLMSNPNDRPVTLTRLRFAVLHENDTLLAG